MHEILESHAKRLMEFDNADDYINYWNSIVWRCNKLHDSGILSDEEVHEFARNFGMNGDDFEEMNKLRRQRPLWFKN